MSLVSTTLSSGSVCPHGHMVAASTANCPNANVFPSAVGELTVAWGAITNVLEPTVDSTSIHYYASLSVQVWTAQRGSSLRYFNVRIGSQQVFDISYDYDFHAFIIEFSKLSAINGDQTPELTSGLIDYQKWSTTNRILVADVSRMTEKDVPQSIQVIGTNAACQGVNMLVIVAFENELTDNRLTGEVEEYTAN
ncbi:unnamed protein product [Phytophthora lilii]|uniref:Unnamed protein product n=1 Tax=Phytophthora lilii TaxID=2077276 RepID=A0A9W6TDR7_9STRA|nr:unnamed protein product [Phytophthora lilii]